MANRLISIRRRLKALALRLPFLGRPQELLIVATQRTGSNFLCECLRTFPRTLALHEVFNPNRVKGLRAVGQPKNLRAELSARLGADNNAALAKLFHRQPEEAWDGMADVAASHHSALFSFKVFEQHLPVATLATILRRRRPAVLFLVRRRLDTYISLRKASRFHSWIKTDTTGLQIEIVPEEFLKWSRRIDRWYARMEQVARAAHLRTIVLCYEDHLVAGRAQVVATLERAFDVLGLKVPSPEKIPPSTFFRQDATASPFARIVDGEKVRVRLAELGQLDYALSAPLAELVWDGGRRA